MSAIQRCLLLHFAGADAAIWRAVQEAGRLPHFSTLEARGRSGQVGPMRPYSGPNGAVAVATGHRPKDHGVLAWRVPHEGLAGPATWAVPAVWELAGGTSTIAVNWPATHPASGSALVVSDGFARPFGQGTDAWCVRPEDVSDQAVADALQDVRLHPREVTADMVAPFVPALADVDQETDDRPGRIMSAMAEAATVHGAATWLAEHKSWDLLAVHFDLLAQMTAAFGGYRAPVSGAVSPVDAALYGAVIDGMVMFVDLMIGRYIELIGPETAVVLVGSGATAGPVVVVDPRGGQGPLPALRVSDIAPTVLGLMGVPVPATLPGRCVAGDRIVGPTPTPVPGASVGDDYAGARLADLEQWGQVSPLHPDPEIAAEEVEVEWLRMRGLAQAADNQMDHALGTWEAILTLQPGHREAQMRAARAALALNQGARGQGHLEALEADGVDTPEIAFLRARLADVMGEPERAEEIYVEIAQSDAAPLRLVRIGLAHLEAHRFAAAEAVFTRALKLQPTLGEALNGKGLAVLKQDRVTDALDLFDKASEGEPGAVRYACNRGMALLLLDRPHDAVAAYERALLLDPGDQIAQDGVLRARKKLAAVVSHSVGSKRA